MKLIDKDALVAWAKETYLCENASMIRKVCYKQLLEHLDTIEVKEVQEEPVSIDFEQELYKAFGQVKDFTLGMRIAKWFYDMGKNSQEPVSEDREEAILKKAHELAKGVDLIKDYFPKSAIIAVACDMAKWCDAHPIKKPVSEDLEEAAENALNFEEQTFVYDDPDTKEGMTEVYTREQAIYMFKAGAKWQKEQFENNRLKHCNSITNEQAELEQGFIDQHLDKHQRMPTYLDAIEYGMNLQKEQMIKDAVDGVVAASAGGDGWVNIATGFVKSEDVNVRFGDKIKIIVVKED